MRKPPLIHRLGHHILYHHARKNQVLITRLHRYISGRRIKLDAKPLLDNPTSLYDPKTLIQ